MQQVRARFNMDEQRMMTSLDNGIEWLQQNQPDLLNLVQQSCPTILDFLMQMFRATVTMSSCLPNKRPLGKREARLRSRDDQGRQASARRPWKLP